MIFSTWKTDYWYTFKGFSGEGDGTPLQYSCLENLMDGGAWWAAVHGVPKSRTQLSDFTFNFHFHAVEKEMATHSSVLAWRIPGMGEPGWAAIYGVAQSRTRLKWLSSSSSSWCLSGKGSTWNAGDAGDIGLIPGLGRFPWRRVWHLTSVFLPGESHGQSSLAGCSAWGHKESDTTEATKHSPIVI